MTLLTVDNLHVSVDGKEIIKGLHLSIDKGKVHALMGPNGAGKSTLVNTLMGHPHYQVTQGSIFFNDEDITRLSPDERAKRGLFLCFQYPKEIPGVTLTNLLRTALNARRPKENPITMNEFQQLLQQKMQALKVTTPFVTRYVNEGFSGGEKKKAEILQLAVLDPTLAILDETDSGLDIDSLRIVAYGVNTFMSPEKCILIITHYKRILEYIKPDKLFIMVEGKVAMEGDGSLVDHLEEKGYEWITKE